MGDWEAFAGVLFAIAVVVTWAQWYGDLWRVNRLAAPRSYRLVLGVAPVAYLLVLLWFLLVMAAKAVRESTPYVLFYLTLGAAALGISTLLFPFLGISARDDVLERRNNAGLIAISGALAGAALCFIGGNIGEGPGAQVVVASAGTAMGSWFVLWILLEVLSGSKVAERITVERDASTGLRLAGVLLANGIVLCGAAAGDWIPGRILHDFAFSAWPALALTFLAVVVERYWPRAPFGRSILIISAYVLIASVWVFHGSFWA